MSDDEPTPEELAEAAALAEALQGESAGQDVPQDALQSAALLRHAGGQGELETERAEHILAELQDVALPPAPSLRDGGRGRLARVAAIGGGLAVAATVALAVLTSGDAGDVAVFSVAEAPGAAPAVAPVASAASAPAAEGAAVPAHAPPSLPTLPSPDAALLASQAAAAKSADALSTYGTDLRPYRRRVMARLRSTYPLTFGLLSTERRSRP